MTMKTYEFERVYAHKQVTDIAKEHYEHVFKRMAQAEVRRTLEREALILKQAA
jgi:hypothetical protein